MASLLCIGLGYCARHYVSEFGSRFGRIVGTTQTAARAAELAAQNFGERRVEVLTFDGRSASADLRAALREAEALLVSAAPEERGDPVLAVLADDIAAAPRLRRVVLLSTIGVYGDHGGGWVDEDTPPAPTHARAAARVTAERAWQALGASRETPVAILRLGGIYGPGRNALVSVASGRASHIVKPGQVFNRIHVADIAQAIDAAFARAANGVFNVVDDAPTPPGDPLVFAATLLGVSPPAAIPFAEAEKSMTPLAASFYAENRRVRNARLKDVLGVTLRYPNYREGLRALHAQEKACAS
jgi:nucleoside-diphosphate-sugar epimerase